jgi:hypothetical protein
VVLGSPRCAVAKAAEQFSETATPSLIERGFFLPLTWCVLERTHMKNQHREQAPPGAIPPIIRPIEHIVCILPPRPNTVAAPVQPKPAAPAAKLRPEPTVELKIANEVDRRVNERLGNLALGFLIGSAIASIFEKHNDDGGCQ